MKRILKQRVRTKVLVTTKTHGSFEGVLWDCDRETLVLRSTIQLQAGPTPIVPVDGELVVFTADVAYMQFT